MQQFYHDLLFFATFIIVLLAMVRIRKNIAPTESSAYKKVIYGLGFLVGFSLVQLGGHQGAFEGIPFLEDPMGRQMVEAAGIVGGLIFLLAGIGAWLPALVKRRGERQKLNRRYFCLKMIVQSLSSEADLDKMYHTFIHCLSSYLGMSRCAVYKYSSRKDTLYLAGAMGVAPDLREKLSRISLTHSELKPVLFRFRSTREPLAIPGATGDMAPSIITPVFHHRRLYGAVLCWIPDGVRVDDDLVDFMSVLGEQLGKQTNGHVVQVKKEFHRLQQTASERLSDACNRASSIREVILDVYQIFRELAGVEYLSMACLDSSGENMQRYTIGASGRMLLEKGVSRQTRGTDVFTVFEEARPILQPEVTPDDACGEADGLFLSCGMRSRLVCPVQAGRRVVAVITLGHTHRGYFTRHHLNRVGPLADIIAGVVQREQLRHGLETKEDHLLRLQLMQRQLIDGPRVDSFFTDACDLLTKHMKCTVARISLLNSEGTSLVSRACRTIRNTGGDLGEHENIPLTLTPWHRMTIDAKKSMLINQEDPESRMPPQESTSALIPAIKSAILVPIMLGDQVRGVISIGEARNWKRRAFGASDLIFAKDVAAKCSLALRMKQLRRSAARTREDMSRLAAGEQESLRDLRSRLKSPLTSIVGAVELLRLKGETTHFSDRYHDLILKSADRIRALTEDISPGEAGSEEIEPERVIG